MYPQLMDPYVPDWMARWRRRRLRLNKRVQFLLTIPHPVERDELVRLIRRRFPAFTLNHYGLPGTGRSVEDEG